MEEFIIDNLASNKRKALDIWNAKFTLEDYKNFAECLCQYNFQIREIHFPRRAIDEEILEYIIKIIVNNKNLESIGFVGNQIGDKGIKRILNELLEHNSLLRELDLTDNQIGLEGTHAISHFIKYHSSLQILCLNINRIDDEGLINISRGLTLNKSLVELGLGSNQIGDKGTSVLSIAINLHPSLKALNYNDNRYTRRGFGFLEHFILKKKISFRMYFDYQFGNEEDLKQFNNLQKANRIIGDWNINKELPTNEWNFFYHRIIDEQPERDLLSYLSNSIAIH